MDSINKLICSRLIHELSIFSCIIIVTYDKEYSAVPPISMCLKYPASKSFPAGRPRKNRRKNFGGRYISYTPIIIARNESPVEIQSNLHQRMRSHLRAHSMPGTPRMNWRSQTCRTEQGLWCRSQGHTTIRKTWGKRMGTRFRLPSENGKPGPQTPIWYLDNVRGWMTFILESISCQSVGR